MIAMRVIDSGSAAVVLAEPPDNAPEVVREGIARRNLVAMGHQCPCGVQMVLPPRAERRRLARRGEPIRVEIKHENACPAVDANLSDAIRRWRR